MIKINNATPTFLLTSEDTMTSMKTALLTVNYQTSLGKKEVGSERKLQGYIASGLFDEQGTNIMQVQKVEEDTDPKFVGKDILTVLTNDYVLTLRALNPGVTIESTL